MWTFAQCYCTSFKKQEIPKAIDAVWFQIRFVMGRLFDAWIVWPDCLFSLKRLQKHFLNHWYYNGIYDWGQACTTEKA